MFANLIDFLLDVVVELAEDTGRQALQIHRLLHCFLNLLALLRDLVVAESHFRLETLHLFAVASHGICFLMPRRVFNS